MPSPDDIPIQICPHVPPGSVFLMNGPVWCPMCEEDVVKEAEQIVDDA